MKTSTVTKIVGSLSIGALALTGCKSKDADPEAGAEGTEAAAEGTESSCSGMEEGADKKGGEGGSCSGGSSCSGGGGSCGGGK